MLSPPRPGFDSRSGKPFFFLSGGLPPAEVLAGDPPSLLAYAMATHSSPLAWKIPWTEEPGRLQTMGALKVR